jgi:hypothetical protein
MYREGLLGAEPQGAMKLLPVTLSDDAKSALQALSGKAELAQRVQSETAAPRVGAIHIELSGRALIRLEGSVDAATVRVVLESLRS